MNDQNTLFQSNEAPIPQLRVTQVNGCPSVRFHNVDCMEFMKDVPDNFYELAIVDPPYGIERFKQGQPHPRGKHGNKTCEWDNKPTNEYWNELFRVSENQIVWGGNNFTLPPTEYFCIWNKQQTVDNFATAEYAWVSMGLKTPAKMFNYSIHKHNQITKIHPTEKPIDLYRWVLKTYAKTGMKILDTHGGSFSSAVACDMEGFDLDICEIDSEYFQKGVQRFQQYKSQKRLF